MGVFKFEIPSQWPLEKRHASTMHVVGLDGIAWPCRIVKDDTHISLHRNRDESGKVFIAYPFCDRGELVVCTGTLPETTTPYPLTVELARGTANRLRNQLSIWQEGGLKITPKVEELTNRAVAQLGMALFELDAKSAEQSAAESLEFCLSAIFEISRSFSEQIVPVRKSEVNIPKFWMGTRINAWDEKVAQTVGQMFDIIQFPNSNDIRPEVLNAIVGPLLDASPDGLSKKLQEVDDFDGRRSVLMADVRERIGRLPSSVKLIHAAAGINGTGHRLLSYPQQLQATIDVLQTIEDVGSSLPTMVSFDCPWGERLAWSVGGVHPLQIADSLLRRGVNLTMLGLDIHLDYWPVGSLPRDPIQWIDLIDAWSQLGLPLVICLRTPSNSSSTIVERLTDVPVNSARGGLSETARLELLETVIPMMLARPAVQGIIWMQTTDAEEPRYPGGGLLNAALEPKPILEMFQRIRKKFW